MADAKISELTEKTTNLDDSDLLVIVDTEVVPQTTKHILKRNALNALYVGAKKASAGTINKGEAVYIVGYSAVDNAVTVELADSSDPDKMPAFGICSQAISDSVKGRVAVAGEVTDLNTSGFITGDSLYVSDTPGVLSNTKPDGGDLIQKIGVVSRVDGSAGVIAIFGAGRSNDLPGLTNNSIWIGDANSVPQEADLDTEVSLNPDVVANSAHILRTDNPHSVTKTQVGLSNVPNTDATLRANHTGTQTASTISDFDTEVSNNADVTANSAHRVATGNPHSATTDDIPQGSTNLYRVPLAFIQYRNGALQTINSANALINFGTDFNSVLASQFTKVNTTDFRADFTGYVRLSYSVAMYSDTNARGVPVWVTRNAVEITGTRRLIHTSNGIGRGSTASVSLVLPVTNGDLIRVRADTSIEGIQGTIPLGGASLTMEKVQ